LQEVRIEFFFPMDEITSQALRACARKPARQPKVQ
jgi:hypothetical protein